VSWWWKVCRGLLGDGGAGGGFVGDGLAGGVGGEQGVDGQPVDGAGQAAGVGVDGADGVVGEERVGAVGVLEVPPDVSLGFGGGQGGGWDVVAELDALVEGYLKPRGGLSNSPRVRELADGGLPTPIGPVPGRVMLAGCRRVDLIFLQSL
jgi:hypothetical protein